MKASGEGKARSYYSFAGIDGPHSIWCFEEAWLRQQPQSHTALFLYQYDVACPRDYRGADQNDIALDQSLVRPRGIHSYAFIVGLRHLEHARENVLIVDIDMHSAFFVSRY